MSRKIMIMLLCVAALLAGCTSAKEKGVGARIRESQGKQPKTYTKIIEDYVKTLQKMKAKAAKEPGAAAFEFLGMAKGVELRFKGDDSEEAKAIVNIFLKAGKAITPGNTVEIISQTIDRLEKKR